MNFGNKSDYSIISNFNAICIFLYASLLTHIWQPSRPKSWSCRYSSCIVVSEERETRSSYVTVPFWIMLHNDGIELQNTSFRTIDWDCSSTIDFVHVLQGRTPVERDGGNMASRAFIKHGSTVHPLKHDIIICCLHAIRRLERTQWRPGCNQSS